MILKVMTNTIGDIARLGMVVTKKIAARSVADERAVFPALVGEFVERIHPHRIETEVVEIIQETVSTKTFRLKPIGVPFPPFRAGQFVSLSHTVEGVHTSRPYTLSSSPTRSGTIDITVRKKPNGFVSRYLFEETAAGQTFKLSGPIGRFTHLPIVDSNDLVFLAGGCGITPFMSMIRQAADIKENLKIHLIYENRVLDDIIFNDELSKRCKQMENLKMDIVISEPAQGYAGLTGLLDDGMIQRLVGKGELKDKTFFICGPYAMNNLCLGALKKLGVPDRRVKQEFHWHFPDITLEEGWPDYLKSKREFRVIVEGREADFFVRCGEPVLNALERNGYVLDSLCRSGECGHCRIRLMEGEVFMPPKVSLRKADAIFGYIHPCMSYPVSNITIRL
jgi:ferredoxin-NADP reductase/ferredoxin